MLLYTLVVAGIFASVHLFSPRLTFLDRTPRSIWLSVAGGVSVAYVFLHLLPELAHHQSVTVGEQWGVLSEHAIFTLALAGFVAFYGLERFAKRASRRAEGRAKTAPGLFRIHIATFAVYNLVIGYLLDERAAEGLREFMLFGVAMALHYVVNDRALYSHHGARYRSRGRWILATATLVGTAAGLVFAVPAIWVAASLAVLGGSVVLNVIKEELPEERDSLFWAFAAGVAGYAVLLIYA